MFDSFLDGTNGNELGQSVIIRKDSLSSGQYNDQTTYEMIGDLSIGLSESVVSPYNNSLSNKFKFGNSGFSPVNKLQQFQLQPFSNDNQNQSSSDQMEEIKMFGGLQKSKSNVETPEKLKNLNEQLLINNPQQIVKSNSQVPFFDVNKLQNILKNGKNEISFIKQDPNQIQSFLIDSFLQIEQDKLDNVQKKQEDGLFRLSTEENLLNDQDLFKEIEQQEIDFDQNDFLLEDEQIDAYLFTNDDENQLNQMANATKNAQQIAQSIQQQLYQNEDMQFDESDVDQETITNKLQQKLYQRKMEIERITEVDEEYMNDDSIYQPSQKEKKSIYDFSKIFLFRETIKDNPNENNPDTQQINQTQNSSSQNFDDSKFKTNKKNINFQDDENLSSNSDNKNHSEGSLDTVDKQWQTCFKQKDSESENQINLFQTEDKIQIIQNPEEQEVNINEINEDLEKIKKESEIKHQQIVQNLISFDFLTSSKFNQENINLKNYHIYFKDQLHLAPTTDARSAILIGQITTCLEKSQNNQFIENYQELGCAGFYGIPNDPEIILSMLLMTNSFDEFDHSAFLLKSEKQNQIYLFNNPQQYLIPHHQFQLLQKSLKKLILNVKKEGMSEEAFNENLVNQLDFGILLLLGKMYFHVCKYKQSIFSLKLAILKCKMKNQINNQDIQEGLMWIIIVYQMFLSNQMRNFKRSVALQDNQSLRESQQIAQDGLFQKIMNNQQMDEEIFLSKNQEQQIYQIIEICLLLKQYINEFLTYIDKEKDNYLKDNKKQIIVLYIQLKLQMFQNSPIFQYFQIYAQKQKKKEQIVKSYVQEKQIFEMGLSIDNSIQIEPISKQENLQKTPSNKNKFQQKFKNFFGQKKQDKVAVQNKEQLKMINDEKIQQQINLDLNETNKKDCIKIIQQQGVQIQRLNSYIGQIAMIEIEIWRSYYDSQSTDQNNEFIVLFNDQTPNQNIIQKQIDKIADKLNQIINQNKSNFLASVKLWQLYVIQGQKKNTNENQTFPQNQQLALEAIENLSQMFQEQQKSVNQNEIDIIITLLQCKSLYNMNQFKDCFEKLQFQYVHHSNYSSLLYLYGKFIVRSQKQDYKETQQYFGSGIGALEECLKTCVPEFLGRVYYYIGLAYSFSSKINKMPIKTLNYWKEALKSFQKNESTVQGFQKQKIIQRYLHKFSFIDLIIELINQSINKNKENKFSSVHQKNQQFENNKIDPQTLILGSQYIQVLTQFQEKVDSPSCLLLKAHIYAHSLKIHEEARNCFQQMIDNHPEIISGYLEYWDYLKQIYKKHKIDAKLNYQIFKDKKDKDYKKEALQQQREAQSTLKQLKAIIKKAIYYSNKCSHVSTSEWVQVRIIASKTYLMEKEINKAIDILTDLCYIIPQNMLQIGKEAQSLVYSFSQKNADDDGKLNECGGIKFCDQILFEDDDFDDKQDKYFHYKFQDNNQKTDKFKNRIFISDDQEQEIQDDFDDKNQSFRNSQIMKKNKFIETEYIEGQYTDRQKYELDENERQKNIFENSQLLNDLEEQSQWNFNKFGQNQKDNLRQSIASNSEIQYSAASVHEDDNQADRLFIEYESTYKTKYQDSDVKNQNKLQSLQIKNFNSELRTQFKTSLKNSFKGSVSRRSDNKKFISSNKFQQVGEDKVSMKENQQSISKFQIQNKKDNQIFQSFEGFLKNDDLNLRITKNENLNYEKDTIFAVNSDVQFLYMIGKFCYQSGQNLMQGLLALNDYYLFIWHNGSNQTNNESQQYQNEVSPLKSLQAKINKQERIKECIKSLLLMGQIYEKLHQPQLSLKLYFKIMEDRETMSKFFGCKKQIQEADKGIARIWKNQIQLIQHDQNITHEDSFQKKILIDQNHFQ